MLQILEWNQLSAAERRVALARPGAQKPAGLSDQVAAIIAVVRREGDAALRDLTRQFDGVEPDTLRVPGTELDRAMASLATQDRDALVVARDNIRRYHEAQRQPPVEFSPAPGVVCRRVTRPIESVGLYVPAGSAPLLSTALMLAVPAAVAGCPRRVLVTPVQKDGAADPGVLAAAALAGIEEVYAIGGAQAIAALAYGTESVLPVDKIFGPGSVWVTEAKQQVGLDPAGAVCDLPAGPSELLVIADAGAPPEFIAADLLSQAEHGADSQVLLLTASPALAERVRAEVEAQLAALPRAAIARAALADSRILLTEDLTQAVDISNDYAPEHLILATGDAERRLSEIHAVGSVFLGYWTPETLGDYCAGTNHVLPTCGFARAVSGLGLEDFQHRLAVQSADAEGLQHLGPAASVLARLEGLEGHAAAVDRRLAARARGGAT